MEIDKGNKMDKRIFVEKKADFRVKSRSLLKELQHNIQLKTLNDLRIVQVYDVFNLAEDLFARAEKYIFSEQVTDTVLDEATVKTDLEKYAFFAIESLPGQFDQRAASSQEALLLLGSSSDVTVNTAQLYLVNKDIAANELEAVKNYLLNQWTLVSKISLLVLLNRISLSLTKRFQTWISLKLIQQKILHSIRQIKDWPWKWMTCSSFKITSSQLDVCQLRLNLRFGYLLSDTAATQPSRLS